MIKLIRVVRAWILFILDTIIVYSSFYIAFYIRFNFTIPAYNFSAYKNIHYILWIIAILINYYFKLYKRQLIPLDELVIKVFKSNFFSVMYMMAVTYIFRNIAMAMPSTIFIIYYFISGILFTLTRAFDNYFMQTKSGKKLFKINTIVVAGPKSIESIVNKLNNNKEFYYQIVGLYGASFKGLPLIKNLQELEKYLKKKKVKAIVYSKQKVNITELNKLMEIAQKYKIDFIIDTDIYKRLIGKEIAIYKQEKMLLNILEEPIEGMDKILKTLLDYILALIAVIILLPVYIIIPILIKLDSRGPVIYAQERMGKHGKIFKIYKFRTMFQNAEKYTGPVRAKKYDPRVTRIGRFLRKTSLDEIPQFFNVLKGDMSIVGPRPEREIFIKRNKLLQGLRLSVKPGITGLAQVMGRNDLSIKEKVYYDLFYIQNYSIFLDLKILLKTIFTVLSQRGAR